MRLKPRCPTCGLIKGEVSHDAYGPIRVVTLECGHILVTDQVTEGEDFEYEGMVAADGSIPYRFQIENVKKAERANLRFLNMDDMGLGKMVQSLLMVRRNMDKMLPTVVVCKARIRRQWFKHALLWLVNDEGQPQVIPQIIESPSEMPYPDAFPMTIVSFDSLRGARWLSDPRYKSIIIDETQMAKNTAAARTQALQRLANSREYIIGNSGTPIKNRASEFFSILNMIQPGLFLTQEGFNDEWVQKEFSGNGAGRLAGIKKGKVEEFRALIEPFTCRTVDDGSLGIPKVFRQFEYHDLAHEVEAKYAEFMAKFMEAYDEFELSGGKATSFSHVLAYMAKMRHLTGKVKVGPVGDYVEEFLENTDRKIAVFHHHVDIGNIMNIKLSAIAAKLGVKPPVWLHEGVKEADAFRMVEEWTADPDSRLFIGRELAEGEGLNLQACGDVIIMERQWNPANEEQVEKRFARIKSVSARVNAIYPIIIGTIDEFLMKMVEHKRRICRETYGNEDVNWGEEEGTLKELAATLAEHGRKAWEMKKQ